MSAGRLQARLSSSAKASWASRSVKDSVVLMDWNTKDAQPAANTAIATLLDILKNVTIQNINEIKSIKTVIFSVGSRCDVPRSHSNC